MHIQKKWNSGVLSGLLFTLLLTGCSSGGGDSAAPVVPAGTAEGLWTGTTGDGRTISGVVLDDGSYWFLYSAVPPANPALMAGTLQGNGSSLNGTFDSSNGLDFSNEFEEKFAVTVTGPYVMQQNLDGTVTYSGGSLPFTSMFDSEYNVAPVIANVAGTYPGSAFGFPHTITVSPLGAINVTTTGGPHRTGSSVDVSGIELGCDFTGTLIPRSNGNVYDISLTPSANASMCSPDTLTGVAFFDATTTNKKIYVLALNNSRSRVFPFTGTRP
jgi:hypothetical protein